ncbi:4,5-dihydroxyphthalate decarboxylase [Pigmentiphaga humi]|uniref:4,5-dihydroxyphthalate decarboxylase n=1 Tax=Pigmentiphaga humi TaxID=2478468 RepID=A0A3P4B041_9BURK|nr:ABC transporter substrate-binding protein [Pigmentiphaga humi]VCU69100.1 4,5-dihydroxyphthalate decarboxylase [Pigmentiphaga humi]
MSRNGSVQLNIALGNYGHTAAFKDGTVPIEGVEAHFVEVEPIIAAFRRMVRDVEFDVCEMAPATYMIAREAGAPFKALPVFVYRRLHHEGLVYRPDAGISSPKDLEGKQVGVRAYSVSTGIWTRGILSDEYGVDLSKVGWVVDDEEHVASLQLPPNVSHAPAGQSLVSMMADGSLQAAFTGPAGIGRAGAPTAGWDAGKGGAPMVGWEEASKGATVYPEMFPDAFELEKDWVRRTGIYPIHGLIVVKDELLERYPWLARALFDALAKSTELYLDRLGRGDVRTEVDRHYMKMASVVGNPLPAGIEENRPAIEALIRYCHEQGLLKRSYQAGDFFVDPRA